MLIVILKRLLIAIPSLIGVVIVTFLLTRALPGDPAAYFAGPAATKEAIQEIRVFGDTAVASGKSHNIVYRNRGGKWLIVDHNISAAK